VEAVLHAVGLDVQTQIIVGQPSAVAGEAQLVKSEPLAVWKDYLTFHAVSAAASSCPGSSSTHTSRCTRTLRGTPQKKEAGSAGSS